MMKRTEATLLGRAAVVESHIRRVRGLNEIEKIFCALDLAASPEERSEINRYFVSRLPRSAKKAMMAQVLQSAEAQFKR